MRFSNLLNITTSKNTFKSFLILLLGVIITLALTVNTFYNVEKQKKHEFSEACTDLNNKIEVRLKAHARLLRNGAAFFESVDTVTRQQWKNFNEKSYIHKVLPGIQGLGYSLLIAKEQLQKTHSPHTKRRIS